jgi:hypothetical protein
MTSYNPEFSYLANEFQMTSNYIWGAIRTLKDSNKIWDFSEFIWPKITFWYESD